MCYGPRHHRTSPPVEPRARYPTRAGRGRAAGRARDRRPADPASLEDRATLARVVLGPLRREMRVEVEVDLLERAVAGVGEGVPDAGRDDDDLAGADDARLVAGGDRGLA